MLDCALNEVAERSQPHEGPSCSTASACDPTPAEAGE